MRIMNWTFLFAFATALFSADLAMAQSNRGDLKNIRKVKFLITGLTERSKQCGLTADALERAFTTPLTEAGLQIVKSSTAYWITIRATSVPYGEKVCVTYIDADAMQTTRYFNTATLGEKVGNVRHWTDGRLIISDIDEHAVFANNAFRRLGNRFADLWRSDQ